jgi:hypothetical protein
MVRFELRLMRFDLTDLLQERPSKQQHNITYQQASKADLNLPLRASNRASFEHHPREILAAGRAFEIRV